ncbi:MAG: Abortive infection protein [Frankiales bacterium]|nr:Abortive infection protein [Frankiales bacterium]
MSTQTPHAPAPPTRPRRAITQELWLVFALSLGASGLRAVLELVGTIAAGGRLNGHTATLNGSQANNPWLDLALQLTSIATALAPVFLVAYFLSAAGDGLGSLGLDFRRPGQDAKRGATLAAVVGGTGLALYVAANAAGLNLTIVAENLPAVWWRVPVLLLSAVQNSMLEEVLVAGYLLHQLRRLGWDDNRALVVSAVLRGSYHLYQGLGGFAGNVAMGLLFGRLYQRWGRVAPLVVAHALIDSVAFVGYLALAGRVSWIPSP